MRAALVLATALVAGVAPVVLGGAAAVAAPGAESVPAVGAASTVEPGTVVQEGGRLTVPAGTEGPVTLRFKATLPAGVTGPVKARVTLPITNWPPGGWTDHRTAARMGSTCSVGGGAFEACAWQGTSFTDDPGPYRIVLDLPAVEASATIDHAVTIDLPYELAWIGSLDAPIELKDASGALVAQGTAGLDVVQGTSESYAVGAVHAVGKNGWLYRYEGTGKPGAPLSARREIEAGWGVYTAVVQVEDTRASGHGGLMARDKDGVLWYHKGTGNPAKPFAPRLRVGAGWNIYTSIAAGPADGEIVARDRDGVLWNYNRAAGSTYKLAGRVKVGGGWNTYNAVTRYGRGAVARDTSGVLWKYDGATAAPDWKPFAPRVKVGAGWNTYSAFVSTVDVSGDGKLDLLARDTAGKLWLYGPATKNGSEVPASNRTQVGWGWDTYTLVF
ncbi:tachylectin-related carbohydrate-binding protein [Streptomyces sp. NBC_01077]|nr:tachylectin-related carbohydrate-binding protein [Streptomyces sp. NBC_01077]